MATIDEVADQFRAELLRRERRAATELVRAYATAWERIQLRLAQLGDQVLAARAEGRPVRVSWLYEYRRLDQVLREVEDAVRGYARYAEQVITAEQLAAVRAARDDAVQLILAGLGEPPSSPGVTVIGGFPDEAIAELVGFTQDGSPLRELLDALGPEASRSVRDELIAGIAIGRHPREVARRIRASLGGNLARSLTIARTEMLRAYRTALLRTYQANARLLRGWAWHAALGTRTCAYCWSMHGTVYRLDERFASHPNCFPAGVLVSGPRAIASTERWYDGELVEIETVNGNWLACTPNHPILTPHGWVAAGLLNEGDDVVSCSGSEGPLAQINPDDDQVPALIEDVARTLRESLPVASVCVPTAPEDFHGDGGGSEVCVVRTNRLLAGTIEPALAEPLLEHQLCWRDMDLLSLDCLGALDQFFQGCPAATRGAMRGFSQSLSLFGRPPGREQPVCLGLGANGHASGHEPASYGVPRDAVPFGQRLFRFTREIPGHHVLLRQDELRALGGGALGGGQLPRGGTVSPVSAILQDSPQSLVADAEVRGGILTRYATDIRLDRVLKLIRRRWSGHVYNLETRTGWYIANGIVTHNCRCSPVPITKTWQEIGQELGVDLSGVRETRGEIEPGPQIFAKLPEDQQRAILGPAKFAAYQAGAIGLEDLRGIRRDPRWGMVGYERSLREVLGPHRAEAYARLARAGASFNRPLARPDRLILEAATGARRLSREELAEVLEHVAEAGFDPVPDKRGRTSAQKHFEKHVRVQREWPEGTTLEEYLESARRVVLDPGSSVLVSQYRGQYQLGVIGPSGAARGPGGNAWIVVEYRVALGHWTTVFQPRDVQRDYLLVAKRENLRWLRRRLL